MRGPDPGRDVFLELRDLPRVDLDATLVQSIKDRAEAAIARGRQRKERRLEKLSNAWVRVVEPLVCCALSLGFVAWVLVESIRVLVQAEGGFFLR
jgi:hypothetical protein